MMPLRYMPAMYVGVSDAHRGAEKTFQSSSCRIRPFLAQSEDWRWCGLVAPREGTQLRQSLRRPGTGDLLSLVPASSARSLGLVLPRSTVVVCDSVRLKAHSMDVQNGVLVLQASSSYARCAVMYV